MPMKSPPHPGHSIKDACLDPLGLNVTEGAKVLGVARHGLVPSTRRNRFCGLCIALGALGHNTVNMSEADKRKAEINRVLAILDGIDWNRGEHWDGVAGKIRPNGNFSTAGGVKDSGSTCYKAIADPSTEFYSRIRKTRAVA